MPIDRDILHIVIGLVLMLIALLVARGTCRLSPFVAALSVACIVGFGMEMLDRHDDLMTFGYWRWQASLADFARTLFFPFTALVIAFLLNRARHAK